MVIGWKAIGNNWGLQLKKKNLGLAGRLVSIDLIDLILARGDQLFWHGSWNRAVVSVTQWNISFREWWPNSSQWSLLILSTSSSSWLFLVVLKLHLRLIFKPIDHADLYNALNGCTTCTMYCNFLGMIPMSKNASKILLISSDQRLQHPVFKCFSYLHKNLCCNVLSRL